jgi:hypothetical protein
MTVSINLRLYNICSVVRIHQLLRRYSEKEKHIHMRMYRDDDLSLTFDQGLIEDVVQELRKEFTC